MSESNIDVFNEMTIKLFERLYKEFPKAINISMKELANNTTDRDEQKIYEDGLLFLAREKFIKIRLVSYTSNTFEGVVLTSKGLSVLNSSPEALKTKSTIGQSLSEIAKSGAKDAYSSLVGIIINAGLGIN